MKNKKVVEVINYLIREEMDFTPSLSKLYCGARKALELGRDDYVWVNDCFWTDKCGRDFVSLCKAYGYKGFIVGDSTACARNLRVLLNIGCKVTKSVVGVERGRFSERKVFGFLVEF